MTISELFEMRNALAVEQYELYISMITNINMRYRDLLTNDLGSTLVKNCAWDAADIIVDSFKWFPLVWIQVNILFIICIFFSFLCSISHISFTTSNNQSTKLFA